MVKSEKMDTLKTITNIYKRGLLGNIPQNEKKTLR